MNNNEIYVSFFSPAPAIEKKEKREVDNSIKSKLGSVLRQTRKSLRWTLEELTQNSGVSIGYLSQIELGKNAPGLKTLYKLAHVFHTSIRRLVSKADKPPLDPPPYIGRKSLIREIDPQTDYFEFRSIVGENIRTARKWKKLRLRHVRDISGVSIGYLAQIENGKNTATISKYLHIAEALNLHLADLFPETSKDEPENDELNYVI